MATVTSAQVNLSSIPGSAGSPIVFHSNECPLPGASLPPATGTCASTGESDGISGNCTACVKDQNGNIYDFAISNGFDDGPVIYGNLGPYVSGTQTPPAVGTVSASYGGTGGISVGNSSGSLNSGSTLQFTLSGVPGSSYAVFDFTFINPTSTLPGIAATQHLIVGGQTTSPLTLNAFAGCQTGPQQFFPYDYSIPAGASLGDIPYVGCYDRSVTPPVLAFPIDVFADFNSVTIDWSGILSPTPFVPPPPGSATVPDVIGFTQSAAAAVIANQGLVANFVTQASTAPVGAIVGQSPAPFASALSGSTLTVYISSGPPILTDAIPNYSYYTAVNPVTNSLYVAVSKGDYTNGGPFNDIVVYSTVDDTVVANITASVDATAATGAAVTYMTVDSVNNVIYASNDDGTVTVIDGATNTIDATITVGKSPTGIAVDPAKNLAYVANSDDTFISVIQGPVRTGGVITTPAKALTSISGILPQGAIAVDTSRHVAYAIVAGAANPGSENYTLAIIDEATNTISNTVSYLISGFTNVSVNALAVDQKSGLVVIADAEDEAVHVYNPQNQGLQSYFENFYPDNVVVDSINEIAYVSTGIGNVTQINLLGGGQSTVYAPSASIANCGYGGTAVAVDSTANEVYFTTCDGTNGAVVNLWNGGTKSLVAQLAIGDATGDYGYVSGNLSLAVNPSTHVAYVSNSTFYATPTAPAIAAAAIDVINGPKPGASPQLTLAVSGSPGITAQPLNSPATYAFGNVPDGEDSAPVLFNITNNSPVSAALGSPKILGSAFTTTGGSCTNGIPVPAGGGFCETTIVFVPGTSVAYAGGLAFLDNERDTPQLVGLTGSGTGQFALTISPSTIPVAYVGLPYPTSGYPLQFSSPNAAGGASINICATLPSGAPNTALCCPVGGYGSCPAGVLPPGMNWIPPTLNATSGSLATPGSYQFSVVASDSNGDTGSQAYTLVIDPAFTVTLGLSATTVTGGTSVTATVTLNQPAPLGGVYVFVGSSNPAAAVSTVVTVNAGQTVATGPLATNPVTQSTIVQIAPFLGQSGAAVALTVNPPQASTVSVPNVIGLTQAAATAAITTVKLTLGSVTQQSSSTVAQGLVISESPAAGTSVNGGSAVSLVISSGAQTLIVPNIVGLSTGAALATLQSAGFSLGNTLNTPSSTVPIGEIVSQLPAAATTYTVTTGLVPVVNVYVSSGSAVPNLAGLSQTAASAALTAVNLKVGSVTQQSSSTVAQGLVISESPAAGTSVSGGSAVNLVISSGTPTVSLISAAVPVITLGPEGYTVTISLQNTGNTTAQTVKVTAATLNAVPQQAVSSGLTSLAPGATGTLTITFPPSAAAPGARAPLAVQGSYTAATQSGNWGFSIRAVSLPTTN
jgi:YVTN family beta-propeller protein